MFRHPETDFLCTKSHSCPHRTRLATRPESSRSLFYVLPLSPLASHHPSKKARWGDCEWVSGNGVGRVVERSMSSARYERLSIPLKAWFWLRPIHLVCTGAAEDEMPYG